MFNVLGRRMLAVVPTLLLVVVLVALLLEVASGDPAEIIAGEEASDEVVEQVREDLGLNRPLPVRVASQVGRLVQGDFGVSLYTSQPVLSSIWDAVSITASLVLVSMIMALFFALIGGTIAALRPGGWVDRSISAVTATALGVPSFVVALLAIIVFAIQNPWFPAAGYEPLSSGFLTWLHHLVLPGLALASTSAAELTRQVRGALTDTLEQDYIRTARAVGLPRRTIVAKHGFKNAAIPVITVFGLQAGRVLGGAVVIEQIFAMSGFGSLAYRAVLFRDIPLVQGVVLCSALVVLLLNLLVDMSYVYFNPKLRH